MYVNIQKDEYSTHTYKDAHGRARKFRTVRLNQGSTCVHSLVSYVKNSLFLFAHVRVCLLSSEHRHDAEARRRGTRTQTHRQAQVHRHREPNTETQRHTYSFRSNTHRGLDITPHKLSQRRAGNVAHSPTEMPYCRTAVCACIFFGGDWQRAV